MNPKKPRAKCLCGCNREVSRVKCTFYSLKCQQDYKYRAYIERWKEGLESGLWVSGTVSNPIKRYLLEKYGEQCQQCGWSERHKITGRVPIQIDHIDGDFTNNMENNLRLLCPNCHSLTPTYGGLNKGNGRTYRIKYESRAKVLTAIKIIS